MLSSMRTSCTRSAIPLQTCRVRIASNYSPQGVELTADARLGVMTSIYNIGCFLGAMSTVWTGDILGRPRQIILGSTIIAIGAIIQTCSWTVASMMVGRIVAGVGTGMNTATAGVWQAETSKMNSRGKLVIIQMGK